MWRPTDPDPPPGTVLEKGNPKDKVKFMAGQETWWYSRNNSTNWERCPRSLAEFWAQPSPLTVAITFNYDRQPRT